MENFKEEAIEKIEAEAKKKLNGNNKAEAVKESILAQIKYFIEQDEEFARAVLDDDKGINECCIKAVKGCGNSISDLEVYQKAVEFYFPGARVDMKLTIDLCGSVRDGEPAMGGKILNFSLSDLLGG